MIQYLKKTIILLMLAAFLVPASGMLVFMHHCRAMGTLELSIDGSNSCCSHQQSLFMSPAQDLCELASAADGRCSHAAHFSKQACCEDGTIYVKIIDNYLSASGFFFQKDITEIVTNQFAKNTTLLTISVLYKRVESDCWLTNWKFNVY